MKHISLTVVLFIACLITYAQDSTKVNPLSEVVVSTSRIEKEASLTPRSVTVISAAQISTSNVKTLPELLSQIESIYIVGNGMNPGVNQSVSMRGTNTNQTAILIDGVLLNDPSSPNSAFDIGDLTLNSVMRIEVVRGSNSSLYGSGAIGGSINIITKDKGDKPFEAGGDFRFGADYNITNAFIRYTDKTGLYASVGLNSITSKGMDATVDTTTIKPVEPRDMDAFHQSDFIAKIGYDTGRLKISASIKALQKFADIDNGAFINDGNNTLETHRNIYQAKAQYLLSNKFTLSGFIAYSLNKRININDSSLKSRNPDITDHAYYKGTNIGESFQSEFMGLYRNTGFNAVFGAGINNEKMNMVSEYYNMDPLYPYQSKLNYKDSNLMQKNTYAFFHADYNFAKQGADELNLSLGGRFNKHNQYGNTMSIEVSPSYTKEGSTYYVSYTNGFLNPSLYQLYANDPTTSLMGNKNLKPQYSKSLEAGFKTRAGKSAYFTIAFYKLETKNPIQYVNLWEKSTGIDTLSFMDFRGNTYINLGTQNNSGIDFSLNIRASEQLSFSLRYAYVESKLSVSLYNIDTLATAGNHVQLFEGGSFLTSETEQEKVVRRPTNTVNVILFYNPVPKLSFRLDTRYISSRYDAFYNSSLGPFGALDSKYLGGYTLMDFHAKYFINSNISIGVKIDNMLNTKYSEIIGYRTRGTTSFFDLQVKL